MRRQLTAREWMLLALLGVVLVVSAYVMLFYMPMKSERESCLAQAEECRTQTEAARLRVEEKRRMERELEELFAGDAQPLGVPDYDNLKAVMFELNSILAASQDYSLTFSTVDASQTIVRRNISISFTCAGYDAAKAILQQLHDSAFRCMLDSVSLSMDNEQGDVSVNGNIVFFEYHAAPAPAGTGNPQ